MATPLSDEIRALITFANETTEAGDTKLGDCVKTLCEGYNGGKNLPSSPLVVPSGAISSRLAALLAYANETTGAGDTTMGDAIKTLCDGYGQGGELIFYESIIGHKTNKPYIDTGFIPNNESGMYVDMTCMTRDDAVAVGCRNQSNSNSRFFIGNATYIYAGWNSNINLSGTISSWNKRVQVSMNLLNSRTVKCEGAYEYNGSITDDLAANTRNVYIGVNHNGTAPLGTYGSVAKIHRVKLSQGDAIVHDFVPCTYNGEAGMWDLVSQTFYGNAASSGQFTVEGEIVMYDRLKSDGTAYIDTGVVANGVLSSMVSFRWMGSGNSPDAVILGARKDSGNTRYFLSALYNVTLAFGTGTYTQIIEKIGESMRSHYLVSQFTTIRSGNSKSYFTVLESGYNSEVNTSSQTVTDTNKSLYLFRNNYSTPSSCNSYMSIHEVKIWDDDTMTNLILHLVPCTLGGVAGMWDKVSWEFFGNSNTSGAFTAENES